MTNIVCPCGYEMDIESEDLDYTDDAENEFECDKCGLEFIVRTNVVTYFIDAQCKKCTKLEALEPKDFRYVHIGGQEVVCRCLVCDNTHLMSREEWKKLQGQNNET